jgi:4-amino-4-deoxy-L-arabinose transferase-like glycosyltransferase
VALALLALAVRLYNLTYHSLWFDEAMSVHWARSSVPRILEVSMNLVEDRLPPLYYLFLHYWRLLVGDGEAAVRLPSVLLGTLLVPLVYRLAADMFRRRDVALLAAALTALNPFLVWYAQEARMYAQAVLLATLGTWFFWRAVNPSPAAHEGKGATNVLCWLGYGLCTLGGLYTHLYTGLLLPAHAFYWLLTPGRPARARLSLAMTWLAIAALFAPLALATWGASGEAGPGDPLAGLEARVWWLLAAFSVWKAPLSPSLTAIMSVTLAALAGLGLLAPYYRASSAQSPVPNPQPPAPSPRLFIALLLLTPPAIASVLLLRNRVAFFGERYFIVVVPWLLVAAAIGATSLSSFLRSAITRLQAAARSPQPSAGSYLLPITSYLLPVALSLLPLPGQWSPAARKEAWRETVAFLAANAQPEDAILIHPDWTRYPLQYYFRGPGQTYAVFGSVEEGIDLDSPLTAISGTHPVVWLVESHTELADPQHRVNAWLAARYPAVTELYPPGLAAVRAYAPGYVSDDLPALATPVGTRFQGGLALAGYAVPQTRVQAGDDLFHPPSAWVHVTLFWTADSSLEGNCSPFVQLIDDLGQVWGASLERPNDAFDLYPPTRWQPGQVIRVDLDVNLNPLTPPGRYTLVAGLRDAAGDQVPLTDGSPQALLAAVEIIR